MAITDNKIHIDPWEQLAFPDMEHASGLELGSIATKTARPEELPPDIQEDEQLSEADRLKQELVEKEAENVRLKEEIEQKDRALEEAMIDPVTGIKNRLAFEKEFPSIFEKDPSPGLLYIDLNGLSRVNKLDDLHAAGDKYLHDVAQALRKELRAGDEIYRIGGDEIAVVLRNVTLEQIEKIIERYRIRGLEGVEHANLPAETYPGVSVGGAIKQPGDRSHEDMIKRADKHSEEEKQAFYQDIERRTGKNVRR